LTAFRTIQPPALSGVPDLPLCSDLRLGQVQQCIISGTQIGISDGKGGSTVSGGKLVINGYDLSAYAPEVDGLNKGYAELITKVYESLKDKDFSTANKITDYMKGIASNTPLTGEMVISASRKYNNVDTKLMVALMQVDSSLGTKGKGARMNNPGNVGTWPGHDTSFRTWQEGVDAVAKFLDTHRVK
jgi:hypothetical protein